MTDVAVARTEARGFRVRGRMAPIGVAGLVIVTVVVLSSLLAPVIAPYGPAEITPTPPLQTPSADHWLGTDELGRDVLSRLLFGGRTSLTVGIMATLLALVIALPGGLIAGYFRGAPDAIVMRLNDVGLAFPYMVLAVGLVAIFGPSAFNAALAIGLSHAPQLMRIVRGETVAVRERDYIAASVADGASRSTIIVRHILPNIANTVIVQATVLLPIAIITEAMLSFLGLGVQPPTSSWGVMLTTAQSYTSSAPLLAVYPGLAIFIAALGFNLFGDGLRDFLDPRSYRS